VRRAEADKELKRRERLEKEMKELVGGGGEKALFGLKGRGEGLLLLVGRACREALPPRPHAHTPSPCPGARVARGAAAGHPMDRQPPRSLSPTLTPPPAPRRVQRASLEARQQDIRDKQLAVQQSTEYVEKLKVG
jgi:hypothetical protein